MKPADEVALKEYFERILREVDIRYSQRFDAQERAVAAALAAAKEAVGKAEAATERRLEGVNEFRKSLEDQQNTFVRQDVADARYKSMEDRISVLSAQDNETKGRGAGRNDIWIILVVVAGLIVSVTALFIHH
jgi:hypothetical protein